MSPLHSTQQRQSSGGFALVIALSLMAFVLLLLLSITTLVQVESQGAKTQMHRMEAEQAALLGLQVALGELQKAAGPDQRVTATAGIINVAAADGSSQHYTGVWSSDPAVPEADRFMQWLVSSSDNNSGQGIHTEVWSSIAQPIADDGSAYSVSVAKAADYVLLVGNGSVASAPTDTQSIQAVVAEKLAYSMLNGVEGKYAWWVGDEGVKAKVNVGTNEDHLNFAATQLSDQLSTAYNLSASPRSGVEVLAPELANFSNVLTDPAYRNDVAKVTSFAGVQILEATALADRNILKGHFHNLTLGSFGLLTNPVKGGLKEDLSLAFEYGIKDMTALVGTEQYLYNYADPNGGSVRGPRWDILQEHYLNYKNLDTSGAIAKVKTRLGGAPGQYGELSASSLERKNENSEYHRFFSELHMADDAVVQDYTENVDGDGMIIPRAHSTPIAPVILSNMMVFSTWVHDHDKNVMRGGGPNAVNLVVNPVAVLWNPYNCHMTLDPNAPEPYILNENDFRVSIIAVLDGDYIWPWSQYINVPYTSPATHGGWNQPADKMAWLHDLSFDNADNNTPDGIKADGRKSALVIPRGLFEFEPGEMKLFSAGTNVKTSSYNGESRTLGNNEVNRNRVMDAQLGWNADGGWVINNMSREVFGGAWTESGSVDADKYTHNQPLYVHNWLFLELWASDTMQTGLYYDSTDFEFPEYYSLKAQRTGADEVGYDENQAFYRVGETSVSSARHMSGDNAANGFVASGNSSWGTGPWSFAVFSEKTMSLDDRDEKEDGSSGAFPQAPELFLFNSPRARHISGVNSSFLTNARQPYSGYKMERLAPSSILPIGQDGHNTFWGESFSSLAGYGRLAMWEIPRLPLTSIAQLQHAQVERFQHEPSYAIGNSYASPFIKKDELVSTRQLDYANDGTTETIYGSSVDSSYLCNEALWDDYFFSSITPEFALSSANYSESSSIEQVMGAFMNSSGGSTVSLANPRVKYVANTSQSDSAVVSELLADTATASAKVAGSLMVDGTFNINSVSVEAWKAFLSGANDIPILNNHLDSDSSIFEVDNDGVVFSRFSIPNQSSDGSGIKNDDWEGYRLLNEDNINDLAVEIVRLIKARGPFYSVADFINRSLTHTTGDDWKAGILQLAIDRTGLNDSVKSSGTAVSKTGGSGSESFITTDAGPGVNKAGMVGYLLQGDILNQLGPFLSNRSNTFKVRTYGESGSLTSGAVPAKAYLEAVIQQIPEYIDNTDSPERVVATGLNTTNASFGRRFRIISITWLNEDEI